jgi:hypothetical protein
MHWQQVLGSSNVAAIAYDEEKQECYVKFNTDAVYIYEDVGPGMWEEFQHTSSKGRFAQIELRRAHKCRRAEDDVETDNGGEGTPGTSGQDQGGLS